MFVLTALKTVSRNMSACFPLVAVLVTSCSLMSAQTSDPDVCHMDSDGFCVTGLVQAPQVSTPQNRVNSASPAPEGKQTVGSTSAPQTNIEVELRDGLLRLVAENITLQDALKVVSAHTGAQVQFPTGALAERVFVHLGPSTPRDIVAQLLKGTQFNYVILSSETNPSGIERVILSKAGANSESAIAEPAPLPTNDSAAPQLYGASFGTDPNALTAESVLSPEPAAAAAPSANPGASWIHNNNGAKLSGEELDRMQKAQIEQEQQQFSQQLQQQRQQEQEQTSRNPQP
jgi:hypothetical protein